MALGGGRLGTALTEHVVGQLPRQSSSTRFALTGASSTSASRARVRTRASGMPSMAESSLVASSLLEDELDDRPLVGGELVEGGHVRRTIGWPT